MRGASWYSRMTKNLHHVTWRCDKRQGWFLQEGMSHCFWQYSSLVLWKWDENAVEDSQTPMGLKEIMSRFPSIPEMPDPDLELSISWEVKTDLLLLFRPQVGGWDPFQEHTWRYLLEVIVSLVQQIFMAYQTQSNTELGLGNVILTQSRLLKLTV